MDFTLKTYQALLKSLITQNYYFLTMEEYFSHSVIKSNSHLHLIMRHDVDSKSQNALRMAKLESELGVKATYYFRIIPKTFKPDIIKEIADLEHEIGYHYENMDTCNGSSNDAFEDFKKNLDKMRKLYPVKTICMHGSPMSKWDNREIWKKYDYRTLGINFEPYFDFDFNDLYYITDTGRRWDGQETSIRDSVKSEIQWPQYHSTNEIIYALKEGTFPSCVLMTVHPQRWTNNLISWAKELVSQNIKNIIKYFLIKYKN